MAEQKAKQSKRYLDLDGVPVGAPLWRRLVTPWTFAASMMGAVVVCNIDFKNEQPVRMGEAFGAAALGIVTRVISRLHLKHSLESAGLKRFVIDTAPETSKHSCTRPELNLFLFHTKMNSSMSWLTNGTLAVFDFYHYPFVKACSMAIPYFPSPLTEAVELRHRAQKIDQGKWLLVGRSEMQAESVKAVQPAPLLQHP